MKVAELMNRRVQGVSPDTPLYRIQELMLRYHLNDIVVIEDENKLVGIVTYSDLFRKMLPSQQEFMENELYFVEPELIEDRVKDILKLPVKEIMTTHVKTVAPDTAAIKAGALMNNHHVKQLPVIENGRVVGIISYTDIVWGLFMKYFVYVKEKAGKD